MKSRKEEGGGGGGNEGKSDRRSTVKTVLFSHFTSVPPPKRPMLENNTLLPSFLPSRFAWSRGDNHETDATDEERELGSGWEISFAIDARVHSLVRGGRLLCFGNLKFEKRAGRSFLLGTKKGVGGWSLE